MQINKSDKSASGLWRRWLFHWRRGRGHLGRYAWNRVRWHLFPRFGWAGRCPDHVDVELSAACNMKCPMCYTTTDSFKKGVPHVTMDMALFKNLVDQMAREKVYSLRLSWRGEPTLHKDFLECVEYAKGRGIPEVDSLSIADRATPEMFERLVELKMDWVTISFDGMGETYEKIRAPAHFSEMVEKIRAFSEIKKRHGSVKPVIRLQGLWPAIEKDPDAFFDLFEPLVDEVSVNTLLDYLHQDKEVQYLPRFICPVPFQRLVVGSDGRAFMCINDELGRHPIGDTKVQSLKEIWGGGPMRQVREVHRRFKGRETMAACRDCYLPRLTQKVPYRLRGRTLWLDELLSRPQVIGR